MRKIHDRFGREFYIETIDPLDSCIIPIDSKHQREDALDDNIQHWRQL